MGHKPKAGSPDLGISSPKMKGRVENLLFKEKVSTISPHGGKRGEERVSKNIVHYAKEILKHVLLIERGRKKKKHIPK